MNKFKKLENGRILTPKFRLSFAELYQRGKYKDQDTGWGCSMIFSNQETDYSVLEKEVESKSKDCSTKKPKLPLHDGTDREYDGYGEGVRYFGARNRQFRPIIKDEKGNILQDDDGTVYSGCYCIASVSVYSYDDGVTCTLHQIKKVADGEPFGAGGNDGDDFGDGTTGNDFDVF